MCEENKQKNIFSPFKKLDTKNRRRVLQKKWIENIRQETGDSYSKIARNCGLAQSTISRFMDDTQTTGVLSATTEEKILSIYGAETPNPLKNQHFRTFPSPKLLTTHQINVIGSVQAGLWREAMELSHEDRYQIAAHVPEKYKTIPYYGLLVQGESMNRIFPDGSIVIVANFLDLARGPETGDYVIVQRRDPYSAAFEATVKAFQQCENGEMLLWPRSTDPHFQRPFVLKNEAAFSLEESKGSEQIDNAGASDITILGLVIGVQISTPKCVFD
ncbi:hypothetical protein FAI41_03790 [Acetobacteraceae bacterium]|nr:hypothetical protein FAI41_03790 [Acetobacteraceae bacterium]